MAEYALHEQLSPAVRLVMRNAEQEASRDPLHQLILVQHVLLGAVQALAEMFPRKRFLGWIDCNAVRRDADRVSSKSPVIERLGIDVGVRQVLIRSLRDSQLAEPRKPGGNLATLSSLVGATMDSAPIARLLGLRPGGWQVSALRRELAAVDDEADRWVLDFGGRL